MKRSIEVKRGKGGWWGGFALALLLSNIPTVRLWAQGVLNEFSYDNLRLSGIQIDAGVLGASDMMGTTVGGIRFDYGRIAPKVRLMFGLSYFRTQYANEARDRFERRLDSLVNPSTPDTINLGEIRLSDVIGDVDFQLVFPQGRGITAYVGTGVSIHVRNGSGAAIDGTFVDDASTSSPPGSTAHSAWSSISRRRGGSRSMGAASSPPVSGRPVCGPASCTA